MFLRLRILLTVFILSVLTVNGQKGKHTFAAGNNEFLLDGKPFQVISCELYPARIPAEHWQHRIQLTKALGCNTIIVKLFWNYHEQEEGVFDFSTWNRNIGEFCRLVKEEGLFLIIDPGPYANEGWELGGVPAWLIRKADLKITDPAFTTAREKYISRLTEELKIWLATNGGPVLMFQREPLPAMSSIETVAETDSTKLPGEIKRNMDSGKSFNFGVIHGGTNFGYTAGADTDDTGFDPYVSSYQPDALINEQGSPTPSYHSIRRILESYLPKKVKLPEVPANKPVIEITSLGVQPFSSFWDNLPQAVTSVQPVPFDSVGQDNGFILYRTELANAKSGKLAVPGLHDYAIVYLNGKYLGKLDRTENLNSIDLPETTAEKPVVDLLVEAMGRSGIDEGVDRKGITGSVTIDGMALENWKMYQLPMTEKFIYNLRSSGKNLDRPGIFFRGNFMINSAAGVGRGDTYIDVSNFTKGIVWVNGHNIGRYWNKNPQKRLYCPSGWIREGMNEIMIFDLHETTSKIIKGWKNAE